MPAGTGVLAAHLAEMGARLAVLVHPSFPEREAWDAVLDSPGENWRAINQALRDGNRGLPGGSSLSWLLAENGRGR